MKTQGLDEANIPQHIAIIMDGNRRWARKRSLPDIKGHEAGSGSLEKVVEAAEKLGIETITVYALSTENIKERAKREVFGLFNLMRQGYRTKIKKMMGNGVKVNILGELEGLPSAIKKIINQIRNTYIKNESIKLNIALNYGGKKELVEAIKDIIKEGININKINDEIVAKHLYTKGIPDPELVIRTGGRSRLSNFLLWQTAYSEVYFTKTLWPDFDGEALKRAIAWYQEQKRNFGR
ncbi:di-trans,poly-cis-decaprenylcistransferase [Candidatus Daviesbacteria bacterium RIFCSPHIGHO2_12_FULL_37_11]|uniref:Isoprenyl transferase n=1 Tax=Candidatus Daviesbacteria bacterium RIFCSPHIGHO2_12_FULL_37_11 TaxID=1797777 RepID=A0A1F5KAG0_9BACT|nr:MAG: di-trans,poly-cis-decaprenylcistransferase [Candidatus Daviesbacteria bacterium GWA1_38_6]OGE37820.1 MAG: di-trans,poly-cis-decaprenylcistransferase [Candidatus Daviesbacteria bacterium RIFCSPHIGHO2_12_FULL_37_11]